VTSPASFATRWRLPRTWGRSLVSGGRAQGPGDLQSGTAAAVEPYRAGHRPRTQGPALGSPRRPLDDAGPLARARAWRLPVFSPASGPLPSLQGPGVTVLPGTARPFAFPRPAVAGTEGRRGAAPATCRRGPVQLGGSCAVVLSRGTRQGFPGLACYRPRPPVRNPSLRATARVAQLIDGVLFRRSQQHRAAAAIRAGRTTSRATVRPPLDPRRG